MKRETKHSFLLFLFIFITWSIYRYFFKFPEWIDEFVAKPLLMFVPTLVLLTIVEKKSLFTVGFSAKQLLRNLLIGLGAGIFIAAEAVLTKHFKYSPTVFNPDHLTGISFIFVVLIPFATGFIEEFVFRGYIFLNFLKNFKSEFIANALSTVLFVLIHVPILVLAQHSSLFDLTMSFVQLFILGTLDCIIFARTKTLVAPTITHGIWNLSAVIFK